MSTTSTPSKTGELLQLALAYRAGGLSLVPCSERTKKPTIKWKQHQTTAAGESTLRGWFGRGCNSVAAVGGKVSGGLLILDFDAAGFYERWREAVGELADGLPVQRTGHASGRRYQVALRCPEPGRNTALAYVPDDAEEAGRKAAIETRAEGGYAILPGSIHPSGRQYEAVSGDWCNIPAVAQARAEALLDAARKLDEAPFTRQELDRQEAEAANIPPCDRQRFKGQQSVIEPFNERHEIEDTLLRYGYQLREPGRFARPGGKTDSVTVEDGRSFHHSTNDPLESKYWRRPFDLYLHYEHGGDVSAAVRAAAEALGMNGSGQSPGATTERKAEPSKVLQTGQQDAQEREQPKRVEFHRISSAELDATNYDLEYLIDRTLVAGQPCIVAGGKKCLKTSIIVDLGITLAVGGFFLGKLKANRTARVGIMSGESGLATIQETARRICDAAGHRLADINGLVWSEDLPRFGSLEHEDALRRFIEGDELEVIVIDPAYLCLPGGDAGNLFVQGDLLRGMAKVCTDTGCMMVLAHHTRKGGKADPFEPPELEDIAWAGFQEFARQWLLVGRRVKYEPGTGDHQLWLNVGGSAGHSALWALDIHEGTREASCGRFWEVDVRAASEARQEAREHREQVKDAERRGKLVLQRDNDKVAICQAMAKYPDGETKTTIRDTAGLSSSRLGVVLSEMLDAGEAEPVEVFKGSHKRAYEGYKLSCEGSPE